MAQIKALLKKTDAFRRKLTRNLVHKLGHFRAKNTELISKQNIKRILICRPNHRLGNQLLITPLVQEVAHTFPDAKIDLFLKGNVGKIIFENYPSVNRLIMLPKEHFKQLFTYIYGWLIIKGRKYDLVINADPGSSSGRLATQISRAKYRFLEEEISQQDPLPADYVHFAKKTIYQLREFLKKSGIQDAENEIPGLDIRLKEEEKANGKDMLNQIMQNDKPTIGIYTFATLDKCYVPKFWIPLYEALKEKYENDYNIIEVLPVENVSQINFAGPHYYSKNIRELASMISTMKIFISADCGMMHLANASKVPVLGLFKFDNIDKYKPYGNKSTGIQTQDLSPEIIFKEMDDIITKNNTIIQF